MDEVSRTTGIMKRDAVGRVSYTEQQREALLDEFERSGLKGAQFALAAGVKYQTFAHWLQRRRHGSGDYDQRQLSQAAAIRLVEVVAQAGSVMAESSAGLSGMDIPALEVLLPSGVGEAADPGIGLVATRANAEKVGRGFWNAVDGSGSKQMNLVDTV